MTTMSNAFEKLFDEGKIPKIHPAITHIAQDQCGTFWGYKAPHGIECTELSKTWYASGEGGGVVQMLGWAEKTENQATDKYSNAAVDYFRNEQQRLESTADENDVENW